MAQKSREQILAESTDMEPVQGTVDVKIPIEELWECFTHANWWARWNACFFWAWNKDLVKGQQLIWFFQLGEGVIAIGAVGTGHSNGGKPASRGPVSAAGPASCGEASTWLASVAPASGVGASPANPRSVAPTSRGPGSTSVDSAQARASDSVIRNSFRMSFDYSSRPGLGSSKN